MKQKKIRKGVIPNSVLDAVHAPEDFIDIDVRTDIRTIKEKLKRKKGVGKKQGVKNKIFSNNYRECESQ